MNGKMSLIIITTSDKLKIYNNNDNILNKIK